MSAKRMTVARLRIEDAGPWTEVTERIQVSDQVDQAREPEAQMTVGFARVGAGERFDLKFPYDEVLVITRGRYTLRTTDGAVITAQAGEAIYLPAGSESASHAEEDTEMVYVASPPDVYAQHVAATTAEAG